MLVEVVQHHLDFVIFLDLVLVIVVDGEHRPAARLALRPLGLAPLDLLEVALVDVLV